MTSVLQNKYEVVHLVLSFFYHVVFKSTLLTSNLGNSESRYIILMSPNKDKTYAHIRYYSFYKINNKMICRNS